MAGIGRRLSVVLVLPVDVADAMVIAVTITYCNDTDKKRHNRNDCAAENKSGDKET